MSSCKFVILIPDGCADWAIGRFGNRTPLQVAAMPNVAALARRGIVGRSSNVPAGLSPGSDVATLGLLGYDPNIYYTGRAPLEAAAQNIELGKNDWAIRCNLVTVAPHDDTGNDTDNNTDNNTEEGTDNDTEIMQSFTAGHISSPEAAEMIETLNGQLNGQLDKSGFGLPECSLPECRLPECPLPECRLHFVAGVSYRNLAILRDAPAGIFDRQTKTFPPHDYTGKPVSGALPSGTGSGLLRRITDASKSLLKNHPVNQKRLAAGKLPVTQIWLWGLGQKPELPLFNAGSGAMITAVDLLRGIAGNIGWEVISVPGITGYTDTDYAAKGRYAAEALKTHDIVCVHIEATDEAGHEGNAEKKIKALEDIDAKTLPPIMEALHRYEHWKVFISPDHPTPCALKTHTGDYVPWLYAASGFDTHSHQTYDEETARHSRCRVDDGYKLMPQLLDGSIGK
ncbi:MAG: cofactor-independent phosphoglycerate mutase [Planctomycetaceae bacterium]|jgi:2,3-bisphosphoglycerate-independent phosphoglycerate mutase|nr:cofactor-independent phosphoglycerate mutase [Planctomycetaceae bacterium]